MIALAGLAALFLLTALAYAMVGFGGGSTYTALLVLADTDYRILPAISLACNITVVTGAVIQYGSAGLIRWKRILPLAALSVPMAFLGGLMEIPERAFITILGLSLLASAKNEGRDTHSPSWPTCEISLVRNNKALPSD